MKKITATILSAAALSSMWTASGQTVGDALRFSDNNYYGTARTIAMGNAFTALGGDLGSVGINPAGSAVNSFSQVTITPAITISGSRAQYLAEPSLNDQYGSAYRNRSTNFTMPNVGVMINWDTRRRSGLKNVTFGFVANGSSNYVDNTSAAGRNGETTFAGSIAAGATGLPLSGLDSGSSAYDNYDWLSVMGLQSGMISTFRDRTDEYIGITESIYESTDGYGNKVYDIRLSDVLDQRYGRVASGSKYDMVFNIGFNISDKVFFGANLGLVSFDYAMNEYFKENAVDPANFYRELKDKHGALYYSNFEGLRYRYAYDAIGAGVYGKFGVIAVPVRGLRIGAAIQTPTSTRIKEHWQHAGDTYFTDSHYDTSAQSPQGEYTYKLVSPFRFNVGAAYTFGNIGLVSADYEMCNYGSMRFKEVNTNDNSAFEGTNDQISACTGASHMLRIGAEIRPVACLAVRAGYNLTRERQFDEYGNKQAPKKSDRHAVSAGLGFSSKGSFFADLAVRGIFLNREYIYPYADYIFDGAGNPTNLTPEILNRRSLWDVVLTFGFRF